MNAKTVSLFHSVNGEPSPCKVWGKPKVRDKIIELNSHNHPLRKPVVSAQRTRGRRTPRRSPFDPNPSHTQASSEKQTKPALSSVVATSKSSFARLASLSAPSVPLEEDESAHMFAAYSDKFKSRKKSATVQTKELRNCLQGCEFLECVPSAIIPKLAITLILIKKKTIIVRAPIQPGDAFTLGKAMLREERELGILNGGLQGCIPQTKEMVPHVRSYFD